MKFAHIADTHIRNLKYHKEYREVFAQLYEKLKEEEVDCIVHCGDIAHTKTQISPEFVDMCADFFSNLADIAPTYLILGNHDGNLRNSSRQDAISPIVEALAHPNLTLLKNSGEISLTHHEAFNDISGVIGLEYTLNVLSVFDRDNWQRPSNLEKINIALYHGSISNCKTDLDWIMENGEDTLDIFDGFDYAMLGDIHRCQSLDEEDRVWYCGSTVQQNHGETNDKGFLVWDIHGKNRYDVKHVVLKNPKPFITIELTSKGKIPRGTRLQEGARLRLISRNNLPLDSIRKAAEISKKRFKPESVTYLSRAAGERGNVEDLANSLVKEDLRDPVVQKELIDEYLKDFHAEEEVLQRTYDLNKKYNTIIEKEEEIARNVNWKLLSLEWNNLFNYGEGNRIDFTNLSGVVGVLGKNFSGKSSIIDSFLFTLFNSTSKNTRKNLNIINQDTEKGSGRVEILLDGKVYIIEREAEKYVRRLKGEETQEAKTDVDFSLCDELGNIESLNGLSRSDTDRNIRKLFGTIEDFLFTSMASQHGALSFIGEGSTKRKEILAKFLDLETFEKKFKMAKEEAGDLKGALRRFEGYNLGEDLEDAVKQLHANEMLTKEKKEECEAYQQEIEALKGDLGLVDEKLKLMPSEVFNIIEIREELTTKTAIGQELRQENEEIRTSCEQKRQLYEKILSFVNTFDIELYRSKKQEIVELNLKLDAVRSEIEIMGGNKTAHEKKVELLSEVPCGEEYSHCKFIKDAYNSKGEVPQILRSMGEKEAAMTSLQASLILYDPVKIEEHLGKYERVLKRKNETANEIAQCELQIEKNQNQIIVLENEVVFLESKKQTYEDNREVIENYAGLKKDKNVHTRKIKKLETQMYECEEVLQQLYVSHGGYNERMENIKKQQVELQNLREEYESYDLFLKCMHPNGISYDIIKKKLPLINDEVAKVLTNVVDFEVFFEEDGRRLNIFIKHPKYDARPLELGSGAEKSIAAMAIRLALLNVSTLPKPNLFILDEPGTSLDEENMEGFIRILDLIKSYFNTVLLVSHLDSLKDCVDTQIIIDRKGEYAYVKH